MEKSVHEYVPQRVVHKEPTISIEVLVQCLAGTHENIEGTGNDVLHVWALVKKDFKESPDAIIQDTDFRHFLLFIAAIYG